MLDREFETQSVDPMFLEPEAGLAWFSGDSSKLELVLGVQSPYDAAEAVAFMLGKARAPFKPARINSHFAYMGGGFGGDVLPWPAGAPRPRPLSAVPGRHQASRLQNALADRR